MNVDLEPSVPAGHRGGDSVAQKEELGVGFTGSLGARAGRGPGDRAVEVLDTRANTLGCFRRDKCEAV